MCILKTKTKKKAKKRLANWKLIRKVKVWKQTEKDAARKKLLERYDIPEIINDKFYAYRGDDECYPYIDEEGHSIDYHVGDIIPFTRRGDIVFFYEITGSRRKHGDYGFSDYATFYDLKCNHFKKIPENIVDPKRTLKIEWKKMYIGIQEGREEGEKITIETQHGYIQGIKIIQLEIKKRRIKSLHSFYSHTDVEARYIKENFSNKQSLPNYYDSYFGVTEAKKDIQKKINKIVANEVIIRQFYIAPKLRGRK